jgi:hypothetical protein
MGWGTHPYYGSWFLERTGLFAAATGEAAASYEVAAAALVNIMRVRPRDAASFLATPRIRRRPW